MTAQDSYVLRNKDEDEVARLRYQHEVWEDATREALDLAGFGPGDSLVEVGCGPGDLALELARRVGPEGRVLGLDRSGHFIDHLRTRAGLEGLGWLEGLVGDAHAGAVGPETVDGVVFRWVLMFVREPERVIEQAVAALRPGGTLLALEYFQFGAIALHPAGEAFARTYQAVHRLIVDHGGDPDVGGRLPSMLSRAGLEVVAMRPVVRIGRPGDPLWRWLEATHRNHANLVEAGLLTSGELEAYYREWEDAAAESGTFFTAPPLMMVVAKKRQ